MNANNEEIARLDNIYDNLKKNIDTNIKQVINEIFKECADVNIDYQYDDQTKHLHELQTIIELELKNSENFYKTRKRPDFIVWNSTHGLYILYNEEKTVSIGKLTEKSCNQVYQLSEHDNPPADDGES